MCPETKKYQKKYKKIVRNIASEHPGLGLVVYSYVYRTVNKCSRSRSTKMSPSSMNGQCADWANTNNP